jgi:hypothetical protein
MESSLVPAATTGRRPLVRISAITSSDGVRHVIDPKATTVVVGPNNSGKSAILRAIRDKLTKTNNPSPVVRSIEIEKVGTTDEFLTWVDHWTVATKPTQQTERVHVGHGQSVHRNSAKFHWDQDRDGLGQITRWFCDLLDAEGRLSIVNPPENIALINAAPTHPIHYLQRDDAVEKSLSDQFRRAFGADLVVHRNAGRVVPLLVGDRPVPQPGEDRVSRTYVERLERLPQLHEQGDGMRSFAGVLLATSVGVESILLIDEPEAFLHPPQARLLGQMIVGHKKDAQQLFVATHSTDVLRGMLNQLTAAVEVLRVVRRGNSNTLFKLSTEEVRELWRDPLLRYSEALDGLFHDAVIVCESDSDCRFYAAISDVLQESNPTEQSTASILWTHCGGKARIPTLVRALRGVDVPVIAVVDFDALREEPSLRAIVESLGGEWSAYSSLWKKMQAGIESMRPTLDRSEIWKELERILAASDERWLTSLSRDQIQAVLRKSSPWSSLKTAGLSMVPAGDASAAGRELLSKLRELGIFVVDCGELESFAKSVPGHGPKWVGEVLKKSLLSDSELQGARAFVQALTMKASQRAR